MSYLKDLRAQIDDFLAYHAQSPLTDEQRVDFDHLDYYDENEALIFVVPVTRFADDEPLVEMQTSTGDTRLYRRWGQFSFAVDGETAALVIYSDPHGHDFFMPFKDTTNGKETYGAGRYLDNHRPGLEPLDDNLFQIDFNYAYNPYCAYNDRYSCPLPPRENWLKVSIQAGEKRFH